MTAIKLFAAVIGVVAAVALYPLLNQYVFALLALIGAIAGGVVVYLISVRAFAELTR